MTGVQTCALPISGVQGGPLEHVIAAKAVAFGEALQPSFREYQLQVKHNAAAMAAALIDKGYKIISEGTDNHCLLIDLRTKFPDLTGKVAEKVLVEADITANKNMVPFDSRSPFQTSGIRLGYGMYLPIDDTKQIYIPKQLYKKDDNRIEILNNQANQANMSEYKIDNNEHKKKFHSRLTLDEFYKKYFKLYSIQMEKEVMA